MVTRTLTIFAILVITVQSQPRTTTCADYKECFNSTRIRDMNIECNGESSCAFSLITTPTNRAGYIRCSAAYACDLSEIALGRKDVYCSAYFSCRRAMSITARNLYCTGAHSCGLNVDGVGSPVSVTNNVVCSADYACGRFEPMTAGGSVTCSGSQSCGACQITAGRDITCNGYRSCTFGTLETPRTVYCTGIEACHESTITAGTAVKLYGFDTTEGTTIIDTPLIEAYGGNPLGRRTVIDSGSLSEMTVKLLGATNSVASDDADIICRSGAVCNLFCESVACANVVYRCLNGATCNISPSLCSTNSGGSVDYISCPIITSLLGEDDEDNAEELEIIPEAGNILESDNVIYCRTENECTSQEFDDNNNLVYCQGSDSCLNAKIDSINSFCNGDGSCRRADFNATYGPNCYGENSCKGAVNIKSSNGLFCAGLESCDGDSIQSSGYLLCRGFGACQDSNIVVTNSKYPDCGGESSCERSIINVDDTSFILCRGLNSCSGATLTSSHVGQQRGNIYSIWCWAEGSCQDAMISLSGQYSKIEIAGYLAATSATINIQGIEVLVSGYQGLAYGIIDSQGGTDLDIVLNAAQSMYGGTLICRSGSVCTVVCKGSSCENMDYLCEDGATCNMRPNGCLSGRRRAVNNDICPNIVNNMDHTEIEGFLQRKNMQRENDGIYIQIQEHISMNEERAEEYIFDMNKYDIVMNEKLGIVDRVISFNKNQMIFSGIIVVSICIGLISLFYKMMLKDREYTQLK